MKEEIFWKIIDQSASSSDQYESLRLKLNELGREDLVGFQNQLNEKVAQACKFPLLEANFTISSYVSDDGFREFRAWLVAQGSQKFFNALADPETIADWLNRDDVDNLDGDLILSVAQEAYEGKFEDDFLDKVKFERDPQITQDWPENKKEYREKWPKLVEKFWNDDRIREMHTD